MKTYLLIFVLIFMFSCKDKKDCEKIYQEYVALRMSSKDEEAFRSLDNAIKCDSNNETYIFEKVNFLISVQDYKKATVTIEKLGKINNLYVDKFPLIGLLKIKAGNKSNGLSELKSIRSNLKKDEKKSFNSKYYSILLTLFFEGKENAIIEINKKNHSYDASEKAILENLKNLINSQSDSLSILYKSFQIDSDGSDM